MMKHKPNMNRRSAIINDLVALRDRIAARTGVENYKVLQYRTIEAIAASAPATLEELSRIKGIGPKKITQYGRLILDIINTEGEPPLKEGMKTETISSGSESTQRPGLFPVAPDRSSEDRVLSVSEYLDRVNDILGDEFSAIKVRGEISGLSEYPSGYYFALKDKTDDSVLNCYLSPVIARNLGFVLGDGMEVRVGGAPGVWKPKGRLNLRVETLELCGEGSLKKAYELLKKKLETEGLFRRKRPLPEFISRIGVITSKSGAVIHDFKTNLSKLGLALILADVRVEGARAAGEIAAAVRLFNAREPELDVLVIMRGGGSLEDLEAFNNERVAREIFASKIPTIAAIGHDRDEPIACLAADRAVSTPTAAAVLINQSWRRLASDLPLFKKGIIGGFEKNLRLSFEKTARAASRLRSYLDNAAMTYRNLTVRFRQGAEALAAEITSNRRRLKSGTQDLLFLYGAKFGRAREKIKTAESYLATASPENNLRLGYSITYNNRGRVIKAAAGIKKGEKIRTKLAQGIIHSVAESTEKA